MGKNYYVNKKGFYFQLITTVVLFFSGNISYCQQVEIIKSDELFQLVGQCSDKNTLHIYNFWATWCAPCIRELPQFEAINQSYGNVDVTLISIYDVDLLNKKVKPFIDKKKIKSKVVLLDETDFNEIIPKISQQWSGAIPASLIVDCRTGKHTFYEQEFKEGDLENTINKILNQP